jgi:hypothetical protein
MAPRTWARPEKSAAGFHFEIAGRGSLSFDINEFRFRGEADGWSLALLPLQFSHCWKPVDPSGASHLVRANYFLTGLLFKGTVDARYKFEFGPLSSQCRKLDASTMN